MSLTFAELGFDLNNREIATLFYLGLALAAVLIPKNMRPHAFNVMRTFFMPKLALLWLLMSVYVAASVWLLALLSLWEWSNLKSTLLWWLTVGFASIFEAQKLKERPQLLRKLVRDTFNLSVIVVFITELVSFPLWVEMPMLPSLVFLALLIAVGERQTDHPNVPLLLKMLRGLQALVGFTILSFSVLMIADNVDEFWSAETLREFVLPLILWLMFVPFIFLLAVYMTYEEAFVHLKINPQLSPIARFAQLHALLAFGWNIDGVKRLARNARVNNIADKRGIQETIQEIKRQFKLENDPPPVARSEGWSPYAARRFLEEYDLVTEDYHRTPWSWYAHAPSVKLNDSVLADRFSYCVTGNERAVTLLRLTLDGSNQNNTNEAHEAFDERAHALIAKAFDTARAATIYSYAQSWKPDSISADGIQVTLDRSNWGNSRLGGYIQELRIQHSVHQEDWGVEEH